MKNSIRGATLTLTLMITVLILTGCAAVKQSGVRQSRTSAETLTTLAAAAVAVQDTQQTAQMSLEVYRQQTTVERTQEGIPASQATVDVPLQSLLDLPDGAGYMAKDGQASVNVQRHGDRVTVTGRCDSIARLCMSYEREVFHRRSEVDSLLRVISRLEGANSRTDTAVKTGESDFRSTKKTSAVA